MPRFLLGLILILISITLEYDLAQTEFTGTYAMPLAFFFGMILGGGIMLMWPNSN